MRLRGRKGIRESLEGQPELVILDPREHQGKWAGLFGNSNPIHVELGMGKGRFISEMSMKHPEINFIGVDKYDELVRRAGEKAKASSEKATARSSVNLQLALFNIEHIEEVFGPGEIAQIYLNFSDPWPKLRHARRRLTHPEFIHKYEQILGKGGQIHLKTDSRSLFEYSLNSFANCQLQTLNISWDLHGEGIDPNEVLTEYEMKFVEKGHPIYRCEVLVG